MTNAALAPLTSSIKALYLAFGAAGLAIPLLALATALAQPANQTTYQAASAVLAWGLLPYGLVLLALRRHIDTAPPPASAGRRLVWLLAALVICAPQMALIGLVLLASRSDTLMAF